MPTRPVCYFGVRAKSSAGVAAKAPKERKENHLGSASLFTCWVNAGLAQKPFSLRLFVAIHFPF
jgi:hypothetical protein